MKTLKKVPVKAENVEFIPPKEEMKEGIIYISREYKTASHLCLCGCNGLSITPLGFGGWKTSFEDWEKESGLSMFPSILNSGLECKSHYIITEGVGNIV